MFDAIIAGAGPAGSRTAELLAKAGQRVLVLEKKHAVGKEACSGLISIRLSGILPIEKSAVLNLIRGARFHCGRSAVLLDKGRTAAFVIDRRRFDNELLERAKTAGAEVHLGEAFGKYVLDNDAVIVNGKYRAKVLVGADGAASAVRRASGLPGKLTFISGAITYFPEETSAPYVDVFYDRRFSPDFFAWRIPRGGSVEYGVASKKNHISLLRRFLKTQNRKLENFYAHPMVFGVQETAGERLILVGDAAAQVKPFSGGGVIYGLLCAEMAARAIILAAKRNDFSKAFLRKNYDKKWKQELLGKIEKGAMLLNAIKSLTDREREALLSLLEERKDEVETFADMDFL